MNLISSKLFKRKNEYHNAIKEFLKANEITTDLKLKTLSISTANFLADTYKLNKNWKESNKILRKSI